VNLQPSGWPVNQETARRAVPTESPDINSERLTEPWLQHVRTALFSSQCSARKQRNIDIAGRIFRGEQSVAVKNPSLRRHSSFRLRHCLQFTHLSLCDTSTGNSSIMYWVLPTAPIMCVPVALYHFFDISSPVWQPQLLM